MDHIRLPVDLRICLSHGYIDAVGKCGSRLTWNKVYNELGKECIREDHNTAETPEMAFVQEQRTEELVSRAEGTTGRKSVRWIGHLHCTASRTQGQ